MSLITSTNLPLLDYAVIGAGVSGLSAAKSLASLGYRVEIFEKSRGTGGRICSKKVIGENGNEMAFDLGCSYLMAQGAAFSKQLENWRLYGVIAPWKQGSDESHCYVGISRNSALTRYLSKGLTCHFSTRISGIEAIGENWRLLKEVDGLKDTASIAKQIIIALPAKQARELLPNAHQYQEVLDGIEMHAQWVVVIKCIRNRDRLINIDPSQSRIIQAVSHESEKPERKPELHTDIIKLVAEPEWSHKYIDATAETVSQLMLKELSLLIGEKLKPLQLYGHRWLYSQTVNSIGDRIGYLDDGAGLNLLGDYIHPDYRGVESAWMSARSFIDNVYKGRTAL